METEIQVKRKTNRVYKLKYTPEMIEDLADKLMEWTKKPTSPWFEAFAIENGIPSDRLPDFARSNEKFAEAYWFAKQWQKQKLIEGGLLNKFNHRICALLLSHAYGIRDQQEIHHQGAQPIEIVHFGNNAAIPWKNDKEPVIEAVQS